MNEPGAGPVPVTFNGIRRMSLFVECVTAERRTSAKVWKPDVSMVTTRLSPGNMSVGADRMTGRVLREPSVLIKYGGVKVSLSK